MTIDELKLMGDDELRRISLLKDKKGRFTNEANLAYYERKRRSGKVYFSGINNRCSKYQSDIDYLGGSEISNR